MIEAKNLTKQFGSLMAVDHINAQIRDGSVHLWMRIIKIRMRSLMLSLMIWFHP